MTTCAIVVGRSGPALLPPMRIFVAMRIDATLCTKSWWKKLAIAAWAVLFYVATA